MGRGRQGRKRSKSAPRGNGPGSSSAPSNDAPGNEDGDRPTAGGARPASAGPPSGEVPPSGDGPPAGEAALPATERAELELEALTLEERLTEIRDRLITNTHAEVHGLFQILGSKRRLLTVNFLAGLARGLGFFLGVTLVGALLIGGTAILLDTAAQTFGLKDVTTTGMVEPIFHKFREVEKLWSKLAEEADDPTASHAGYVATPYGLVWTGNGEPDLPATPEDVPIDGRPQGRGAAPGGDPRTDADGDDGGN